MSESGFDQEAWLNRIGYLGSRGPTLETLCGLIDAHSSAIAYESIDVLLDQPPRLDIKSLQEKMIAKRRGGYCFEQNFLFRAGLRSLGFDVTSLQARVVRGLAIDAPRPMLHMILQVNLPEGPHLADVGFGNLAPTAALKLKPDLEQDTPHELMRFIRMGDELALQSKLAGRWEHIYRVVLLPRVDAEYEICNWYTASHPDSPYRSNLIAARPGPGKTRVTLFNARLTVRHANGETERRMLENPSDYRDTLLGTFGLELSDAELALALETVARKGAKGAPHPFFA
jgi:N-hydroxyarylamine O-acetyltransferase